MGAAQCLENGNRIIWFGADIDPTTLKVKSPQTYTLVEADASSEAGAVARGPGRADSSGNWLSCRALPLERSSGMSRPPPLRQLGINRKLMKVYMSEKSAMRGSARVDQPVPAETALPEFGGVRAHTHD